MITQGLKMAFITQRKSETYRERKRVSWSESQPLQSAQHKDSEAIYDMIVLADLWFFSANLW